MIALKVVSSIREETVVAYFKILSWHSPGETE
jgi:hypothetical protein